MSYTYDRPFFQPRTGELRMKYLVLMPFVWLVRGLRQLMHPRPFVLSCEGNNYSISHRGRSLAEVKEWFTGYYQHALMCPGCGRILLPGEKVSRCKNGIAHHTIACAYNLDYLGVIGSNGRVMHAYPKGQSMEEMARRARATKTHDL